ncbi:retrograde regulation protein 2 [Paecilomyces variotii No. 5]|uniref:Retrograde regulation protein 2 n=1 Tax=Byssochlamys spectabilis (strain No. 5 / NBRC 109023) TaxID=1356009 RepID=V5FAX3_BYSSN|nr:retrograde regulation protein 2 [Paecilomyces variotii No. 5]
MAVPVRETSNLYAVVDMGSNGIRFSITDLSEPTARILPSIFHERAGISLYDAQFSNPDGSRGPIPEEVVDAVVTRLSRFKSTCEDFGVSPENVYVLATEATRTAPNSVEFRARIKESTGWDVSLLSKEDEGRIGALGVASSFASVEGLVMDLGGGSTQITWMIAKDGVVTTSPRGSVSFPYGAAALTRRLAEARKNGSKAEKELKDEMRTNFQNAYEELQVPESLLRAAEAEGGFDLYLCGGGFRGWGYLLMSESRVDPYPIPIINGFRAGRSDFYDTLSVLDTVKESEDKIFRVSKRRASQVPAVALLVNVLAEALPVIKGIQFCQGGVREGFLYDKLPQEIRTHYPLVVATAPYASASAKAIGNLLTDALPSVPSSISSLHAPSSFTVGLITALANMLFAHSTTPKESRPAAALYSTTTGILASANNLAHVDRAMLALILCERWNGDLSPAEQAQHERLRQLITPQEVWWCQYLGRVAALIGDVYPAGVVSETNWRIRITNTWQHIDKKKGREDLLCLTISVNPSAGAVTSKDVLEDTIERIEKTGKKKNWAQARSKKEEDYGVRVAVEFRR